MNTHTNKLPPSLRPLTSPHTHSLRSSVLRPPDRRSTHTPDLIVLVVLIVVSSVRSVSSVSVNSVSVNIVSVNIVSVSSG